MGFPVPSDFQPEFEAIDFDKWRSLVMEHIAGFINRNADALKKGKGVDYQFPVYRDGGAASRLWKQHYNDIATEVRGYGWDVGVIGEAATLPMLVIRRP